MSPSQFKSEQDRITKVETTANQKEKGESKDALLAAELKEKHDIFFKQVDGTQKIFESAKKLKDKGAKSVIDKDEKDIKDNLFKVAQSGENILAKTEADEKFTTIRQSAAEITAATKSVEAHMTYFNDLDKAQTHYDQICKPLIADILKNRDSKDLFDRSKYLSDLKSVLGNLGESGAFGEIQKYELSVPSLDMQQIYDQVANPIKDSIRQMTDLRITEMENIEYQGSTEKMPPSLKQFLEIKRGSGSYEGLYGLGYDSIIVYINGAKSAQNNALTESDPTKKQAFLESKSDQAKSAQAIIKKILPSLQLIKKENLPEDLQPIYSLMLSECARYSTESESLISSETIDDQKTLQDISELYSEGKNSVMSQYQDASKEKGKINAYIVGDISKMPILEGDLAEDTKVLEARDAELNSGKEKLTTTLTNLYQLKSKLSTINYSHLTTADQITFDKINKTISENIQDLAKTLLDLKYKKLSEKIDSRGTTLYDETPSYFHFKSKLVAGKSTVEMTFTEEFKKLPTDKQQSILMEFKVLDTITKLEIQKQMASADDKNWIEGMNSFEQNNWQLAKKMLLEYYNKNASNPNKQFQINSTLGILQGIMKQELNETKERLLVFENDNPGHGPEERNQVRSSISEAWKNYFLAEQAVKSGTYISIEQVWAKIPKPTEKLSLEGIPWLEPNYIQSLLSEPDPIKRKANILEIAQKSKAAGLNSSAKKYFDLYFADQLNEQKLKYTKEDARKAYNDLPNHQEIVKHSAHHGHQEARIKLLTELNKKNGTSESGEALTTAALSKWEANYKAADQESYLKQIEESVINGIWEKMAKQNLHQQMSKVPDTLDEKSPINVWHAAYGEGWKKDGIKINAVENITDSVLVTEKNISTLATEAAIKIQILALAAGLSWSAGSIVAGGTVITEGAGIAHAAHGGAKVFLVEGLVANTVNQTLSHGLSALKPGEFAKSLLLTYATLGLLKFGASKIHLLHKHESIVDVKLHSAHSPIEDVFHLHGPIDQVTLHHMEAIFGSGVATIPAPVH